MTDRLYRRDVMHTNSSPAPLVEVVLAVCPICDGTKEIITPVRADVGGFTLTEVDCPDCLPDKDGNPSGFVVEAR